MDEQLLLLPAGATSTVTPLGVELAQASRSVRGPLKERDFPILPKRADGWYFRTPFDGWPEAGPYDTRQEAGEARDSFVRNWIGNFTPSQISVDWRRKQPARKGVERRPSKPKGSKRARRAKA
jgi:hypothetical protein